MKVQITKTFGNFNVVASAEVPEVNAVGEIGQELITVGLLYIFERNPSTAVEQKVFAPMLDWKLNEKGTTYKRPAGFNRNSVTFTTTLAQEIKAAYESSPGKLKVGDDVVDVKFTVESITEHESGGDASCKMATEMEAKLDAGMKLALGIKDTDGYDQRIEKCHKFLSSLRSKRSK